MEFLEFDRKTAYEFKETYIAKKIKEAKEAFQKACKIDNRFSKEYVKHISNIDNIEVKFNQYLKYDIICEMSSVDVDYSYDYTMTYSTGERLTGNIKIDTSTGKADTSGLHITKDYHSSNQKMTGSTCFFSTEFKKCFCHFGNLNFNGEDAKNYQEIPVKSSSNALYKKLYDMTITKEFITKTITLEHLPEFVRQSLKADALRYSYGDPRNFKMQLSDYSIRKLELIVFPVYEMEVYTTFEGEVYSCKNIVDVNKIEAKGPHSNHFEDYNKGVSELKSKYNVYFWPTEKIYFGTALFTLIIAIGLIVFLCIAKSLGNVGFALMYKREMIAMIVVMAVITIGLFMLKARCLFYSLSYSDEVFYNPKKPVSELLENVNNSFKKQKNKSIVLAVICLSISVILSITSGIISFSLYKKTNVENYWYTPEIVRIYEGTSKNTQEKFEISSCDEDGKVLAIYTSVYKGTTAQMKYAGKITRKDYEETYIEFQFVEWIINPGKGSPESKMYIYFYQNDYEKMSGSLNLSAS